MTVMPSSTYNESPAERIQQMAVAKEAERQARGGTPLSGFQQGAMQRMGRLPAGSPVAKQRYLQELGPAGAKLAETQMGAQGAMAGAQGDAAQNRNKLLESIIALMKQGGLGSLFGMPGSGGGAPGPAPGPAPTLTPGVPPGMPPGMPPGVPPGPGSGPPGMPVPRKPSGMGSGSPLLRGMRNLGRPDNDEDAGY